MIVSWGYPVRSLQAFSTCWKARLARIPAEQQFGRTSSIFKRNLPKTWTNGRKFAPWMVSFEPALWPENPWWFLCREAFECSLHHWNSQLWVSCPQKYSETCERCTRLYGITIPLPWLRAELVYWFSLELSQDLQLRELQQGGDHRLVLTTSSWQSTFLQSMSIDFAAAT